MAPVFDTTHGEEGIIIPGQLHGGLTCVTAPGRVGVLALTCGQDGYQ